jgi:hypothetical protein
MVDATFGAVCLDQDGLLIEHRLRKAEADAEGFRQVALDGPAGFALRLFAYR